MRRNSDDIFGADSSGGEVATEKEIKQIAAKAAKEAVKAESKRGRKAGSGKKAVVDKGAPENLGSVEKVGRMPDDCYKVKMGRGFAAYSPSTKKRYKLTDGKIIHLGRKEGSTNTGASTSAKPASGNMQKLNQIAKILGVSPESLGGGSSAKAGHLPGLKITVVGGAKPKAKAKKETALAKNDENAADENKKKQQHETRRLGPYEFTLLKNPVTDFEVAGIKVVPAGLAALSAAFVSAGMKKIPQVAEMKEGALKDVTPAAGVLAAAVLAHWYAKKNGHQFVARVASDAAAFGIAFGLNALVGKWVDETVDTIAVKISGPKQAPAPTATEPAKTTTTGGRFASSMSGGAFGRTNMPQLDGYVGRAPGYPQAQLAGSAGYPPAQLSGGADSVQQIAQLSGGRFQSMGGIDLSGLRD